jgi:hypothetical protein
MNAGGPRRALLVGAVLLVALVVVGIGAGERDTSGGPALSPTSTGDNGTRALVLLLQELGTSVRVGQRLPDADTKVALLLHDGLTDDDRVQLRAWVRDGGVLVVADPISDLSAEASRPVVALTVARGLCTLAGVDDVETLSLPLAPDTFSYRVEPGAQSCFGNQALGFVVRSTEGAGAIVSVGSPNVFVNDQLGEADNSLLAARLLQAGSGTAVAVLDPNPPGSGRTVLGDLIADRVFQAILQLGVAFVVYALWRARRLGRPVVEPQPVAVDASQLVRAVGDLQRRSHGAARAAATLRDETRRAIADRFGVAPNADSRVLADVAAQRTHLSRDDVVRALETPVDDDATLVALARELDIIAQEVLDGTSR